MRHMEGVTQNESLMSMLLELAKVCAQANRLADHMGRQCVTGTYEGQYQRSDFKKPAISH